MHLTLDQETAQPPQTNLREQQRAFDRFRKEYDQVRPHEALGQKTPASVYHASSVEYPEQLQHVEYDSSFAVRQVRHNGEIWWKNELIYVTQALAGEPVGLLQIDDELWQVNYSFHPLGILDERIGRIRPSTGNV
jgi:hypothetical protein